MRPGEEAVVWGVLSVNDRLMLTQDVKADAERHKTRLNDEAEDGSPYRVVPLYLHPQPSRDWREQPAVMKARAALASVTAMFALTDGEESGDLAEAQHRWDLRADALCAAVARAAGGHDGTV